MFSFFSVVVVAVALFVSPSLQSTYAMVKDPEFIAYACFKVHDDQVERNVEYEDDILQLQTPHLISFPGVANFKAAYYGCSGLRGGMGRYLLEPIDTWYSLAQIFEEQYDAFTNDESLMGAAEYNVNKIIENAKGRVLYDRDQRSKAFFAAKEQKAGEIDS